MKEAIKGNKFEILTTFGEGGPTTIPLFSKGKANNEENQDNGKSWRKNKRTRHDDKKMQTRKNNGEMPKSGGVKDAKEASHVTTKNSKHAVVGVSVSNPKPISKIVGPSISQAKGAKESKLANVVEVVTPNHLCLLENDEPPDPGVNTPMVEDLGADEDMHGMEDGDDEVTMVDETPPATLT